MKPYKLLESGKVDMRGRMPFTNYLSKCPICGKEMSFKGIPNHQATHTRTEKRKSPPPPTEEYRQKRREMAKKLGIGLWMNGRKLPKEHRQNIRLGLGRGKDSASWKGGKTKLSGIIRSCVEYKDWRTKVFQRDRYCCRVCGEGGYMESHHIYPFYKILEDNKITTIEMAFDCRDLWNIENGITLCKPCHKETDTYLRKPKKIKI